MDIAVTGASGHIGVNLCRRLLEQKHSVRVLIHKNFNNLKNLSLDTVQGDIMDSNSLEALVQGVDVVFHLAAVITIRGKRERGVFDYNVQGTRRILEASRKCGVRRFVHFSSIHALVQEPYDEVLEETRALAVDGWMMYSRTKALAEVQVQRAVREGMDAVIINPTAVIGPFDYGPSLLGRALILMAQGKLPILIPGGYDWVDVRDVVEASIASIEKGGRGERYLLSGHWKELKQLAGLVSEISHCKVRRSTCPLWLARLGLPFIGFYCKINEKEPLYTRDSLGTLRASHRRISHDKASRELGFSPRPLEETLRDTLDWFKKEGYLPC